MSRFSFFEKFVVPFTVIVFITAILSSMAPYINPQHSWFIALLGLGFPFIYLFNFIFLIFWMIRRRIFFFLMLIPFIIGIKTVPAFVQLIPIAIGTEKKSEENEKNSFKVMSFNVRCFDLYNWTGNYLGTAKTRENIFKLIEKESPDIVCFQEFFTCDTGKFRTIHIMKNDLKMIHSQVVLPIHLYKVDHWGMAIFSKYPIINKSVIYFGPKSSNMCLYSDIVVKEDTLRVYNCHLQSIRFRQEDYKYVHDFGNKMEEEKLKGAKKILQRLKVAFTKRALQADTIIAHINSSPYPVLLCGDFNDTPSSYTYAQINNLLCDAFKESGSGISTTYIGPFPAFRVDYIFHSATLSSFDYRTINEKLSDHYPVICKITINKNQAEKKIEK